MKTELCKDSIELLSLIERISCNRYRTDFDASVTVLMQRYGLTGLSLSAIETDESTLYNFGVEQGFLEIYRAERYQRYDKLILASLELGSAICESDLPYFGMATHQPDSEAAQADLRFNALGKTFSEFHQGKRMLFARQTETQLLTATLVYDGNVLSKKLLKVLAPLFCSKLHEPRYQLDIELSRDQGIYLQNKIRGDVDWHQGVETAGVSEQVFRENIALMLGNHNSRQILENLPPEIQITPSSLAVA